MNFSHPPSRALARRLEDPRPILLDGGLATELERRGHDLSDPLWSAAVLLGQPEGLGEVHRSFVEAGAEVVIAATYQASFGGFATRGLSHAESERLLVRAVDEARGAGAPLTAASIGPYGAFLANGAEYTGDYPGMDEERLLAWHRPRLECLAESGADLLACETIPSAPEARALARLIEAARVPAWLSFSCGGDGRLHDGTPLQELARELDGTPGLLALGVNCTAPSRVSEALGALTGEWVGATVVYPNSGEDYDADRGAWDGDAEVESLTALARGWVAGGVRFLGGCCRTEPRHIAALAGALDGEAGGSRAKN